ncbi:DnaD domain-containing protein [Clostridium estertheticum]|uniref:DnaD domain-containing protein n=1 Tax=Clostridium estertheticum TaxID=238834 RepID=UPI001CF1C3BC|nr:DnaD domain protein [Clostridium estertheticum]MCB2358653.1 DnaD domain protein [Clostridium estertheticum]
MEFMILNWIKYNVPDNKNAVVGIQRQLLKIKNKAFLEILYEICKVACLDVDNIFKDIIVNVMPTYKNNLSPMHLDSSEEQSNNIIIKPLSIPLVGATKHVPSNRIKNKEEVEATTKKSLITNSENPAATEIGINTIIKIFEENIHAITPLVYEKILGFTKYVSDEVIIMAITEAVNYNAKNIKYISKVINSWISEGIKTAEEVVTYQKKWNSNNRSNSSSSINSGSHSVKSGSFCDYEQRTYDFEVLEKQLLGIAL